MAWEEVVYALPCISDLYIPQKLIACTDDLVFKPHNNIIIALNESSLTC